MQEKDVSEKILIEYPDVFANIVNAFFKINGYGDKALEVKPEDLEDIRGWSFYKATNKIRSQERDTVKLWKPAGISICLLGIENQTRVDRYMPFRVSGYEGADYRDQLNRNKKQRKKIFYPVITIVLYYGIDKRWNAPRSLFDFLDPPEWARPFINDCRVNVLELAWLSEEQEKFFTKDMRFVINYLRQIRTNKNYVPTPEELAHYQETFNLLQSFSRVHAKLFEEAMLRAKILEEKGKRVVIPNIFEVVERQAIQKGREEGRKEGREEGREEGRKEGREEGREEGRKEGRKEERREILHELSKMLSPAEISKLLASLRLIQTEKES